MTYLFPLPVLMIRVSAKLYTLLEITKAHGLDQHICLGEVFRKLPIGEGNCVEAFEVVLRLRVKTADWLTLEGSITNHVCNAVSCS